MHGKAFWKPGIDEIAKASKGIALGPTREAYNFPYDPHPPIPPTPPSCNG